MDIRGSMVRWLIERLERAFVAMLNFLEELFALIRFCGAHGYEILSLDFLIKVLNITASDPAPSI